MQRLLRRRLALPRLDMGQTRHSGTKRPLLAEVPASKAGQGQLLQFRPAKFYFPAGDESRGPHKSAWNGHQQSRNEFLEAMRKYLLRRGAVRFLELCPSWRAR